MIESRQGWPMAIGLGAVLVVLVGCESYFFLPSTLKGATATASGTASVFSGDPFTAVLIQGRTFFNGKAATTITYKVDDPTRTPFGIDFNGDGKIDPVAGYALDPSPAAGIIQILLSQGGTGTAEFLSLTLDGNNEWVDIADVAVADIDNDGAPDIVAATSNGVIYLHNPGPGQTTKLRDWGAATSESEFISGSTSGLTSDELNVLINDLLPPGTTIDDYEITVAQGYTNVEIADLNRDNQFDILASRRLRIDLKPQSGSGAPPVTEITGSVQVFLNPRNAKDGDGWQLAEVGQHERINDLDRQGASSLLAYDMDGDGDLDIVSAARSDDNVQVAWFENPGSANFFDVSRWTQWRIGSVRDPRAIDIADVTGDGRPDCIATGGEQKQLMLFEQPATGPGRDYDWDSFAIVTFENFEPRDAHAFDIDNDGTLEIVVGGTEGAVRYFEPPADPRTEWTAIRVVDFESAGEVGGMGFGDLDGDGDFDLIVVTDSIDDDNNDGITWIRNELIP